MSTVQGIVSLNEIHEAVNVVSVSPYVNRTPLVRMADYLIPGVCLYAKLEGMQNIGLFKIRGVVNMVDKAPAEVLSGNRMLISVCRKFRSSNGLHLPAE